jgi:hypothetical protein
VEVVCTLCSSALPNPAFFIDLIVMTFLASGLAQIQGMFIVMKALNDSFESQQSMGMHNMNVHRMKILCTEDEAEIHICDTYDLVY